MSLCDDCAGSCCSFTLMNINYTNIPNGRSLKEHAEKYEHWDDPRAPFWRDREVSMVRCSRQRWESDAPLRVLALQRRALRHLQGSPEALPKVQVRSVERRSEARGIPSSAFAFQAQAQGQRNAPAECDDPQVAGCKGYLTILFLSRRERCNEGAFALFGNWKFLGWIH